MTGDTDSGGGSSPSRGPCGLVDAAASVGGGCGPTAVPDLGGCSGSESSRRIFDRQGARDCGQPALGQ